MFGRPGAIFFAGKEQNHRETKGLFAFLGAAFVAILIIILQFGQTKVPLPLVSIINGL
jgi:hypothetical protein